MFYKKKLSRWPHIQYYFVKYVKMSVLLQKLWIKKSRAVTCCQRILIHYLTYNTTKLLNYYNADQCILFIDLFIINTSQCIYTFNTNTGLMRKKINKKYTLTCINDKKINKKYTLTCIICKKIYIDLY